MYCAFRKSVQTVVFSILIPILLIVTAGAAEKRGPEPALHALTIDGAMPLSPSDRCPVCAMFPAKRPRSAAAMSMKNRDTFYFCGNGCLLRSWLRPLVYLGQKRGDIDRLVVLDYFSGLPIDARKAIWIAGSDVIGPMGPAIVALIDEGQLATFKKRHGGKIVFHFDEVNDDLWRQISKRELPDP